MINKQTVLQILEDRKARLTDSLIDDALEVELDVLINKISNLSEEDSWTPIYEDDPETFPKTDDYILVSFENRNIPDIGRCETDDEGSAFYPGDDEITYTQHGLIVNAWQPLPKSYRPSERSWKESMLNKFLGGSSQ